MAAEVKRIDKWLWCVRLFKTRTQAADACNGGKVKLNGQKVKAAKDLKTGDEIEFKRGLITCTYIVTGFPTQRVGAPLVIQFYQDTTPETELVKLENMKYLQVVKRDKGSGRPTKKERRDMEGLSGIQE